MRTERRFKRAPAVLITALVLGLVLAGPAPASKAQADRSSGRDRTAQVRSQKPPLVWVESVLQQDRTGTWMLADGTPLRTAPGLRWRESRSGREASPAAGRTARLMGQWRGSAFLVRQATLISQQEIVERMETKPVAPPDQDVPVQPN